VVSNSRGSTTGSYTTADGIDASDCVQNSYGYSQSGDGIQAIIPSYSYGVSNGAGAGADGIQATIAVGCASSGGENIGWINFGHAHCDAAIDPATGEFSGHAWSENVGWLTFRGKTPAYGMRTLAFDKQPHGTPNWWLDHHAVKETHDAGDGVVAWRKFVMDTDPNVAGDYLRLTSISNAPAEATDVSFTPASTRRFYTLIRRDGLTTGGWGKVDGQVAAQYATPGEKTMQDTNAAPRACYAVRVSVTP